MTRREQIEAMDNYIKKYINNEELIYGIWFCYMPDGATADDYDDIAEDDDLYNDCLSAFARCCVLDK